MGLNPAKKQGLPVSLFNKAAKVGASLYEPTDPKCGQYGTITPFEINGVRFIAVNEYHPLQARTGKRFPPCKLPGLSVNVEAGWKGKLK
jgi:hypothetical protein